MEIGVDSFAAIFPDPATGRPPRAVDRIADLLEEIETADRVGLDVFGIGEHHRAEFLDSAPAIILAAAAARTTRIRLTSAVTVLGATDPVRVFQEFATLDLISKGRAELVVGRGSFGEAFPLFGLDTRSYDDLFAEKLDLLLRLREQNNIVWKGRFRPSLNGLGVYPRPHQSLLPVWLGVGGTPQSFVRAGTLGLPLMIAIIGGTFARFRPLVDLYRDAGVQAGHDPSILQVGLHAIGFVGETGKEAGDAFYPGWAHLMSTVGRERGLSPPTRQQFDDMTSDDGAYLVGDPAVVTSKIRKAYAELGGLSRITFQMSTASLATEAMRRSITLLGEEVAPRIRESTSVM